MRRCVSLMWIVQVLSNHQAQGFVLESSPTTVRHMGSNGRLHFQDSPMSVTAMAVSSAQEEESAEIVEDLTNTMSPSDQFAHLVEENPFDDPEPPVPSVKLVGFRHRKSKLNPYDIPPDPDEEWEWFFAKLKARNNDGVTFNAVQESLLRNWMANQRKSFMKSLGILDIGSKANWGTEYLTFQRKKRLDDIQFYWGHLQPSTLTNELIYSEEFQRKVRLKYKDWIWNPTYETLCQYYEAHGHTNIPLRSKDGLGVWAARQRLIRWEMPARRRERLDDIKFQWDWKDESMPLPRKQVLVKAGSRIRKEPKQMKPRRIPFPSRLAQLKEYRIAHGDCNVPLDYIDGLGKWVKRIKRQKNKLSPRSVIKLEKLGLEFVPDECEPGDGNLQ